MERRQKIGFIILAVMIAIAVTTAIFLPFAPDEADISLWLPQNAIVAKGPALDVGLSGTVVTISFETFRTSSTDFVEQKVIIAEVTGTTVVVHYLGKDKDGFTYHATQQYFNALGIYADTIRLEGKTLKYGLKNSWFGKVLIISAEGGAGVIALVVGFRKPKDC